MAIYSGTKRHLVNVTFDWPLCVYIKHREEPVCDFCDITKLACVHACL